MKTARVVCIITMIVASVQLAYAEKPPAAPVPQTGQTTSIAIGDDGDLQAGVPLPTPRFTINNDGTVTDNLTGLVWLQNAGCSFDPALVTGNNVTWPAALSNSQLLADGQCGLTDRSKAGDWRLPNIKELNSLLDYRFAEPMLSNTAGTGQSTYGDPFTNDPRNWCSAYWSSTYFHYSNGPVVIIFETATGRHDLISYPNSAVACMWPVRDLKKHKGK